MMKQKMMHQPLVLTLRHPPVEIARAIRERAKMKRMSLNKAAIELLLESMPGQTARTLHHDLDRLAGCWSKSEADGFDKAMGLQRSIDRELWKK